jgi:integrase/recombinase XerC
MALPLPETTMDSTTSLRVAWRSWLSNSVLAPHSEAFVQQLRRGRYASHTIDSYLGSVAHFARWMSCCCLPLGQLDEHAVELFVDRHLPHCDCPRPIVRDRRTVHAACTQLLAVLRERQVIAEPVRPSGPIEEELARYDEYMRGVQGLSEGTRRGRVRLVGRLLRYKFPDRPLVITDLAGQELRQFISQQLDLRSTPSNAMALTSALRRYLRYRASCGDRVQPLLSSICSPAHWSLASLPRALSPGEINRLLKSFTAALPAPRRGLAIVRCALDLGLRSSEVAHLQLADIDWRAGTLTLRSTKTRRQDVLPLPASTGRALAAYLRHERPKTSNPAVFVRRLAPRDQPIGVDAVRRVIRDAYRRIGLTHGRTHALRHALACRLLDQGSSLKEVADVLRHRSLNTTLIYAKLDHRRLSGVVLPWPGSTP